MKCVACGKLANYMLFGNSYCEEHKEEHRKRANEAFGKIDQIVKTTIKKGDPLYDINNSE